jgi:hypothetical protein
VGFYKAHRLTERLKRHNLIDPVHELRREFAASLISLAPRLLVMKIITREKSTLRLSPSVMVAFFSIPQQQIPEGVARLLDLVEKDKAELHRVRVGAG